ncbi:MAG: hypothetical protein AAF667_17550 [Pseudomonadota bacterium]
MKKPTARKLRECAWKLSGDVPRAARIKVRASWIAWGWPSGFTARSGISRLDQSEVSPFKSKGVADKGLLTACDSRDA